MNRVSKIIMAVSISLLAAGKSGGGMPEEHTNVVLTSLFFVIFFLTKQPLSTSTLFLNLSCSYWS